MTFRRTQLGGRDRCGFGAGEGVGGKSAEDYERRGGNKQAGVVAAFLDRGADFWDRKPH